MRSAPLRILPFAAAGWLGLFAGLVTGPSGHAADVVADGPIARTVAGRLRGRVADGIFVFKGIPYGEDTTFHRFQAAPPPRPWFDVRDALEFGPMAPQGSGDGVNVSEDCLHLNVWTPALHDGRKRPVLVYFHGGAYNNGSVNEDLYDGTRLSRRGDVVVVTVNHRLNGFGYLYLAELGGPEFSTSGNVGQLDLIQALQWVRDNIAEFGGDPGCVTIFGQSGGGAKCATLMAMPAARGLFQRVWTMSGQQITGRTRAHATASARVVLNFLGLPPAHVNLIKIVPRAKLIAALRAAGGSWTPVVDGDLLPRDPFAPDASPVSANIPMVMGNTRDETASLIGGGDPATFNLDWESLPGQIAHHVRPFMGDLTPAAIVAEYRMLYPAATPSDVFFSATTAARSWKGFVIQAERRAQQGGASLYLYNLDWRTPVDGGKWRSPHTLDIPLVFDNVAHDRLTATAGPTAQQMADLMSDALIAFARTGDPHTPALPGWPRFETEHRPTMIFDLPPRVEDDPRGAERRFFAPVPYVQPGT